MNQNNTILPSSTQGKHVPTWKKVAFPVLGLALLGLIILGIARLSGSTANLFSEAAVSLSRMFSNRLEFTVKVEGGSDVVANEPMTISFVNPNNEPGTYALVYPCGTEGFYFQAPKSNSARETVYCDTPYPFVPENNSITLIPVTKEERFIDVEGITVLFTPRGESSPSQRGDVAITVENKDIFDNGLATRENGEASPAPAEEETLPASPSEAETPAPAPAAPAATTKQVAVRGSRYTTSDPNGQVDLAVRVIETGVSASSRNPAETFVAVAPKKNQLAAVKVVVTNLGTKTSKPFEFEYELPLANVSSNNRVFKKNIKAMRPGDAIEFVIAFEAKETGTQAVRFEVNPDNAIEETTDSNNKASAALSVRS
jgi:hypothetical protein